MQDEGAGHQSSCFFLLVFLLHAPLHFLFIQLFHVFVSAGCGGFHRLAVQFEFMFPRPYSRFKFLLPPASLGA